MPRARLIKPSICTNEVLGKLPPLTRFVFAVLSCFADREGRLEDRPERLKVEILPHDTCSMDEILDQLATTHDVDNLPFIRRYQVDGRRLIQITKFAVHQRPHSREAESILPPHNLGDAEAQPRRCLGTTKAMPRHNLGSEEASPIDNLGCERVPSLESLGSEASQPRRSIASSGSGSSSGNRIQNPESSSGSQSQTAAAATATTATAANPLADDAEKVVRELLIALGASDHEINLAQAEFLARPNRPSAFATTQRYAHYLFRIVQGIRAGKIQANTSANIAATHCRPGYAQDAGPPGPSLQDLAAETQREIDELRRQGLL